MNKITGLSAKTPSMRFVEGGFYTEENYPDVVWICALVKGYQDYKSYQLINLTSGNRWSAHCALSLVGGKGTWTQVLNPFTIIPG